ncbi:MAG: hypothetical protein JRG77_08630 [Deltaproteobacteria bacterium]|nr:hypothetical protein [Deltaproteobacteria bacterium]
MLLQRLLPEGLMSKADNYWKSFVEASLSSGLTVPDDPYIINIHNKYGKTGMGL